MNITTELRQECADLVRQGYEALNRGAMDEVVGLIHPEFQCDAPAGVLWRRRNGPRGFEGFIHTLAQDYDEFRCRLEELRHAGELLVALVREEGYDSASGEWVEREAFHIWTIRDRKAIRFGRHPRLPAAA
jgi:ketosteroid isomerase-like protein